MVVIMVAMMGGMMGEKMTSGHGKQQDNKQSETKSGQGETASQKTTADKSDSDGLVGCHSGATQDDASEDKKTDTIKNKQEHTH